MHDGSDGGVAVFFYGLFMDAEALRARGFAVRSARPATVHGFALRLGRRATLVPDAAGEVPGMVMVLSRRDVDALYAEPSVAAYRPVTMTAMEGDGTALRVRCYVLPETTELGEPAAEYAARLCALLARLGLPTQHVTDALARGAAPAMTHPWRDA